MLKLRSAKKKTWIALGLAFALIMACSGVVYFDHGEIDRIEGETGVLRTRLVQAKSRARKIPRIEERVLRERLVVKRLAQILPDDDEINNFVNRISEFAKDSGVEIESLDDKSARTLNVRKRTKEAFVKIVYKLTLTGSVSELLHFMHLFETHDRFVSVNQFSIRAQKRILSKDAAGPRQHSVDLELETYVYNPAKFSGEIVTIVNSGQKLKRILETAPVNDSLELESYDFSPKEHYRDPFLDPRDGGAAAGTNTGNASQGDQAALLKALITELGEISAAVEQESGIPVEDLVRRIELGKRLTTAMVAFKKQLEGLDARRSFPDQILRKRYQDEVEEVFSALCERRPPGTQSGIQLHEIQIQHKKMVSSFDAGEYPEVLKIADAVLASLSKGPENTAINGEMQKIEALAGRARTHHEFSQRPMTFGGYVYQQQDPLNAVVIINGRAYSPGDVMADGIVIRSVDPHRVVFVFRKEEITRRYR